MPLATPPSARLQGAVSRYQLDGTTLSPERAVVLLYQRLERDLSDALHALEAADAHSTHIALVHAQEIVDTLDTSLQRDGWQGAAVLGAIYEHLARELLHANLHKDPRPVRECQRLVASLAEAWRQAWAGTAEVRS